MGTAYRTLIFAVVTLLAVACEPVQDAGTEGGEQDTASATEAAVTTPAPEWDLPEAPSDVMSAWGDVPYVPHYARTYLYLPEMLPHADPLLIAVSSAEHLEPSKVWMIKVVVSATNNCRYCLCQAVIMANETGYSQEAVFTVQTDIDSADLPPKDKALLSLAKTLTVTPAAVGPAVEAARAAGWSEPQIAQSIFVAAAWNFTNRFANGFGLPGDWLHPYAPDAAIPMRTCGSEEERKVVIDFLSG